MAEEKPKEEKIKEKKPKEEKPKEEKPKEEKPKGKPIGKIAHYYSKIGVGIIELKDSLKVGDTIQIKGHSTDFSQPVESMQLEHEDIEVAKRGQSIGVKVKDKVREGDEVYKE